MSIITMQRRIREAGRIRIGQRGAKGQPQKLSTFRFTSFNRHAIEAIAAIYGGTVKPCVDKDLIGQFEVVTAASEIAFYPSPVDPSQYMELWSGGGCQRRCDGQTELLTGKPCMCEPGAEQCRPTTRLPVILPDVPDAGVWRLESHGWNAAAELLSSYDMVLSLAGRHSGAEFLLALEERTGRVDGKTTRFMVPVIRTRLTPRQMLAAKHAAEQIGGSVAPMNAAPSTPPTLGAGAAELPPSGAAPGHETPDHVLKDANPRGAVFALLHELGCPPHEGATKVAYYHVFGKVIGRKLTTLSDLTDAEWQAVANWVRRVADGKAKLPKALAVLITPKPPLDDYDPYALADDKQDQPGTGLTIANSLEEDNWAAFDALHNTEERPR